MFILQVITESPSVMPKPISTDGSSKSKAADNPYASLPPSYFGGDGSSSYSTSGDSFSSKEPIEQLKILLRSGAKIDSTTIREFLKKHPEIKSQAEQMFKKHREDAQAFRDMVRDDMDPGSSPVQAVVNNSTLSPKDIEEIIADEAYQKERRNPGFWPYARRFIPVWGMIESGHDVYQDYAYASRQLEGSEARKKAYNEANTNCAVTVASAPLGLVCNIPAIGNIANLARRQIYSFWS